MITRTEQIAMYSTHPRLAPADRWQSVSNWLALLVLLALCFV